MPRARRGRRGEGSVYYAARERAWIARWPLGTVNGKRHEKRVRRRTEAEADEALAIFRRLYGAGGRATNETLGQYLARWLPTHRDIRESTRISYAGHIAKHIDPLLGGIPLLRLQRIDVDRLVSHLSAKGLAPGTVHLVFRTLSVAMTAAISDRIIFDNPCVGVRLPRLDREPVVPMTDTDAGAILDAVAGTWIELPVRVLLGSGMRLGEVCGLDQGDVLLEQGYVRVRRTKTSVRAVPVSDDAVDALREALVAAPRRGIGEPVFFNVRAPIDRVRAQSITHALPRILEDAGLPRLSPHALRHGVATMMLSQGTPMRVISEQLGHRSPALTARVYAHVVPESQRAAIRSVGRRGA